MVALEASSAVVGDEQRSYALRVTTLLRRGDGDWKVVHRHGDEVSFVRPGEAVTAP